MFRETGDRRGKAGGRSGGRRLLAVTAFILAGAAALPGATAAGSDAVKVSEDRGVYSVAATFTVPQAPSFAWAALTDYAGIARFMPEVVKSDVINRTDDRAIVEQEAIARFLMFSKRVHLVLEVQEERGTIRFRDRCGKSFSRYEGVWSVAEQNGRTRVTYELSAQPSFDVPEFLLKRLLKRDASQMIARLKAEISARAR